MNIKVISFMGYNLFNLEGSIAHKISYYSKINDFIKGKHIKQTSRNYF